MTPVLLILANGYAGYFVAAAFAVCGLVAILKPGFFRGLMVHPL